MHASRTAPARALNTGSAAFPDPSFHDRIGLEYRLYCAI
jgi:hypothetical protein